jgi:AbrB family looped-hinge helix DNA binding protein
MALATITTKGQLTIPKDIRDSLKLNTGDKVEIFISDKREAIIRPISKKVDEIFCKLHKPGRKAVSFEEMEGAVRNRMREQFK